MGGFPGEPIIITKILISGRQKGQSQRRGYENRGGERLSHCWLWEEGAKKCLKRKNLKSVCLYIWQTKKINGKHESEKWSRSVLSDPSQSHGLSPARPLHPWNFPGKNTGVGCHLLFQGIFPTQGSNPGLPYCRHTYTMENMHIH